VLVQVKNKRERSSPVRTPSVEKTSRLRLRDPVANGVKCGPHGGMNNKVVDGFLVEPQNQGRVGTTWEPSHEWRLAEATSSSRGLQWFTRKPLGYSVEPQNRGRRLDEEVRPPRTVQPPRRGGQTAWAGQIARVGLTAQGGGLTARVAGAEMLRSGGHVSGSQGLRRG
jgi:hypothetical protein